VKTEFVSVIIPAYNEAPRIERNLERLAAYLSAKFSQFEIIVVDDGSTDETAQRVAPAARKEPRIRLVSLTANRGKGFAVRQGMAAAKGDVVCFMDADLSTPVEEIEEAANALQESSPVVIASRQHPDSAISLRQGRLRENIGKSFNRFVRALFGLPFEDTQCGFKCFTRRAAHAIFARARIDGFAFDVELLVIARNLGYRVREIPVNWTNSPDSKVRPARDLPRVVRDLLKIYANDRRGLYGAQRADD
jgi:dolichyl-phosphate beta-glucosyltransferase